MARTKKGTPPSYPTKPHKGQARITVRQADGRRREIYLGAFGSPESRAEYRRVLAALEAGGGCYPVTDDGRPAGDLSVNELALRFWVHAEERYRLAFDPVQDLYGDTLAGEFGPLKLKAVRQRLIDARKYRVRFTTVDRTWERWLPEKHVRPQEGSARWNGSWLPAVVVKSAPAMSRRLINQRIDHVKRVFRWAVSEELVLPAVGQALASVAGLRRGHKGTYDRAKVKPVPDEDVEKTLPFLRSQVAAMVQLQRLMGARPTEVCLMRGRNIDRSGDVWWYRIDPNEIAREDGPANLHKTAHHEHANGAAVVKVLPIGPRAQEILKPWLRENPDEFLFQPREVRAALYAQRRQERQTPLYPAHLRHQARKKRANPKRAPRDHYDRYSYGHAVARAARKAGVPHWHPHRLKHAIATEVRKRHGAEAAQVYVGHARLSTTEIDAESNLEEVARIAREIG
jgi:integrase